MPRSVAWNVLFPWVVALFVSGGPLFAVSSAGNPRRFEVRDSVEMSQFTEPGTFSPDGRYFVTVTQRGLLPQGVTETTVWLFDVSAVRESLLGGTSSPAPVQLARLTGAINGSPLIGTLSWEADSEGLLFLGHDGRENRQLFRVRLGDHQLTALSSPELDVVDYASARTDVVYFAGPKIASETAWWSNDPSAPDIVVGTGQSFMNLLFPNYERHTHAQPTSFEVWRVKGQAAEPVLDASTGQPLRVLGTYNVSTISLSPDGSYAAAITAADQIPELWERYTIPPGPDLRGFRADSPSKNRAAEYERALQYQLFDLDRGTRRPLLAAPVAEFQRGGKDALLAAWSPDERYVAVSGTYMPLDQRKGAPQSTQPCAVAVIDPRHGHRSCLIDRATSKVSPVAGMDWESGSSRLRVRFQDASVTEYELHGGGWKPTTQHSPLPTPPLALTIRQDLNDPPVLVAGDQASGREEKLFDPNPQLVGIDLGTAGPYEWKDPQGRSIQGVLVKPPGFSSDHRYPLVIQTHGFRDKTFFKVGASETSNAGRALACREMLVLQVREPHTEADETWREPTVRGTDVYVAAIDQLAREGLIDPAKVGISGYSRTGLFVSKAITEAPERFAAAVIANADPGSLIGYYEYIDYATATYAKNAADVFAGALPYGAGLQKWLERAPGFRTDRIRAPVLISAADPQHLISLWGLYAPLRDQGKPVELQYIRSGQHTLTKPLQILAHQEMLVDWFDFWLNGHEDPNSAKAEQYARWWKLREASGTSKVSAPQ
jgi:hypothetical protein